MRARPTDHEPLTTPSSPTTVSKLWPDERPRRLVTSLRYLIPGLVLTLIAITLAWLNRSPWWGWALVVTQLVVAGATVRFA